VACKETGPVSSDAKKYEAVIGLEVHAQMRTGTKIFCSCPVEFGRDPNTLTCPVCAGMPGVLPVLNEKALELSVLTGLATNCKISSFSQFARKNYFYPDLPKGYQISQYDLPICEHGWLDIDVGGKTKRIGITRIHMEDDAGKSLHQGKSAYSLVDLNRTGTPLMEIVSEPDLRSPEEASAYMKKLRSILRYIGACDGNMEQGSLRCDANVSIREKGDPEFGTRAELKNINSFRFVERAIAYEIKRQIKAVEAGEKIVQETRLFDTERGVTVSMRSKEEAHDYRYFPDPDLVPIVVDQKWVEGLRKSLPELPDAKLKRYAQEHGLSPEDARQMSEERELAEWFEEAVNEGAEPKATSNWIRGELTRLMNDAGHTIEDCPMKPEQLVGMLKLIDDGTISNQIAKSVLAEMYQSGKEAGAIVKEKGLTQVTDTGAIEKAVLAVIENSPEEAERLRSGEKKLMGFFVGQIMKAMKGKADPKAVNELLKKHIGF
jgi:aspartyl-tRNA(Asn)/glutamyl-tRNA(Gln) amidotransferase subunit B